MSFLMYRVRASNQGTDERDLCGLFGLGLPNLETGVLSAFCSAKKLLEYYATRLNSVEVNYTFRSLPSTTTVDSWLAATGGGFPFSFKAPQRITHILR